MVGDLGRVFYSSVMYALDWMWHCESRNNEKVDFVDSAGEKSFYCETGGLVVGIVGKTIVDLRIAVFVLWIAVSGLRVLAHVCNHSLNGV